MEKVTSNKPEVSEREKGIRGNAAYYEILNRYDEALLLFERKPRDFESTNKREYEAVSDAYHAALVALDTVIDEYVACRVAQALLFAVHAEEAEENAFDQALTDFGAVYARAAVAKDAPAKEWEPHAAAMVAAEEKVKQEALRFAQAHRRASG